MNRQKLMLLTVAGAFVVAGGHGGRAGAQAGDAGAAGAGRPGGKAETRRARSRRRARSATPSRSSSAERSDGKDFVITTMQIKNMAAGPIAGLKVDDFWYDKGGNPLPSDSYRHPRPLQPGEVITVTLETPRDAADEPQSVAVLARQRRDQAGAGAEDVASTRVSGPPTCAATGIATRRRSPPSTSSSPTAATPATQVSAAAADQEPEQSTAGTRATRRERAEQTRRAARPRRRPPATARRESARPDPAARGTRRCAPVTHQPL